MTGHERSRLAWLPPPAPTRPAGQEGRVPPGQYVTQGFPTRLLVPHLYFWKNAK